jgi:hypothetical protein
MANIKYADPSYTDIPPTDDDKVMFRTAAGGDARGSIVQPKGYIDGLKMVYVSGTQVQLTPGAAYVPGPKRIAELASAVTLTPSLAANTWYHSYLTVSGSTVGVEAVTTAPASPYSGTARAKTGDTSRRYIGSFRTDAAGAIYNFRQSGTDIYYLANIFPAPFQVLANGSASTATSVSCASVVPETARIAVLIATNSDPSVRADLWNSEGVMSMLFINGTNSNQARMALNASQALIYAFASTPSGVLNIRVSGYQYER